MPDGEGTDLETDPTPTARPSDDSGSETMARYAFQITVTAIECVHLLIDESIEEIVCELDEDFVVVRSSGTELVSVKHLEPSRGPWTLASLIGDGGLKHLFENWKASGKRHSCRLMTNGGLKTGANEASAIRKACEGEGLESTSVLLAGRIGAESAEEAREFLQHLTIQDELPKRDDLKAKFLVDGLPSIRDQLEWPEKECAERFEALCTAVWEAAKTDFRSEDRSIDGRGDKTLTTFRTIAKKTMTRAKIEAAVINVTPASPTIMVEKLDRGGFHPTDVERCKRLRSEWLVYEQRWDPGLPGPAIGTQIRRQIQDLAAEAEADVLPSSEPYGREMRAALLARSEGLQIELGGETLSTELLLGAAYDETDKCNIWWSELFSPTRGGR